MYVYVHTHTHTHTHTCMSRRQTLEVFLQVRGGCRMCLPELALQRQSANTNKNAGMNRERYGEGVVGSRCPLPSPS